MKTRVAIVLPYFGNGGAENMVSRLASNLDLTKVDAEVICIYGKPQNNLLEKNIIDNGVVIKYIGKGIGFSMAALKKLFVELSSYDPDIIHTHLSACVYCAPWVLLNKVKMLHTIHNMPVFELIKPKRLIMSFMYWINKAVPVGISHEIQMQTRAEYNVSQEVELVYNPVDVNKYANVRKKKHNDFVIVNVGRLSKQKNQKLLIDAFELFKKRVSNTKLYILGDGPLKNELEEYVLKKGLSEYVFLTGNVGNVEEYFAESDLFVLSSIYEGLPLVVLEAMAARLPIVSTNVGGVKDIVTDNGLLVKSESVVDLYESILCLYEDNIKRDILAKRSFENVLQYDSYVIANKYIDLYEKYSKRK